ncbi:hypothetical protein PF005_g988 [Phytophthora fragariae]|uniref:Uncharacterized protein n=2 Tax=Phytophthora TaxID=4783 RepID=A0A6A3LLM2_9STRA|nr:hypothetical protein PF009_g6995 [Phytophthora fragariae]KAE9040275.1 hypothetical protein PR002_g5039 [Phytophthora rubi]KAE9020099.1 hypothetical protein PF011_g5561 [Phytophthora fragariae]KAE9045699.1 hypothetical protein PR001_g4857 [Phytophthora rubi]KAE9124581.1 hypothetical protein PF010_g5953 [Phytophthora fragariae]
MTSKTHPRSGKRWSCFLTICTFGTNLWGDSTFRLTWNPINCCIMGHPTKTVGALRAGHWPVRVDVGLIQCSGAFSTYITSGAK